MHTREKSLFDAFVAGKLSRRELFGGATKLGLSLAAARVLLNQAQSEASHAWVQLYLPLTGWKGFDPTNGILTQTEHVRVAVGRNYLDATPTSGTIFVGGGGETLSVDVKVEPYQP